ncbi:MAG: hypothetical protein CHACPFDD_00858 [Phycisphaerae bacterium]|nr:hypothetical protein [Phycisphaerae bacterium]
MSAAANSPSVAPVSNDPLDEPVTTFRDVDRKVAHDWSIRDACEGTQIFGATGSGKTTGSGYHLATRMLAKGFGGLVLCAKSDEAGNWRDYLEEAGRLDDRVELAPDRGQRFDFMDYEYQAGGGARLTPNLVALFTTAIAATGGDDRGSSTDPYWADALRQLVTNAIDLAALANKQVRLADVNRIITTAPPSKRIRAYLRSDAYTAQCLRRANDHSVKDELTANELVDLEQTIEYWLNDFAGLAPRTRSIIVSSFTSRVTGLLRGPLQRLFCPTDDPKPGEKPFTVTPEETRQGKVIVLNLPIKDYGEVGRFAQILFKTIWQRAIERLAVAAKDRTVFLWADESQYFVTNHDVLYQQTARSKRAATVYLTQSLPNYYAMLATRDPVSAAQSLLGNLQTKIFHANGDPTTNEWAERVFGRHMTPRETLGGDSLGHVSSSRTPTPESAVLASEFTTLRKGGPANDYCVDAIVFQAGQPRTARSLPSTTLPAWSVLKTAFTQSKPASSRSTVPSTTLPGVGAGLE